MPPSKVFAYDLEFVGRTRAERASAAKDLLTQWLQSDALQWIASRWSADDPPTSPERALEWWDDLSTAFDYRSAAGYRERWQADTDPTLTDSDRQRVDDVAATLGLLGHHGPRHRSYSAVIVLGAGRMSPLLRTQYAAELLRSTSISAESVYLLGSIRPLDRSPQPNGGPSEFEMTRGYAPQAINEYGLIRAAAVTEFGVEGLPALSLAAHRRPCDGEDDFDRWSWERFDRVDGPSLHVMCARRFTDAPGQPRHRPNTADTYELLGRIASPIAGERALIVTTQLFVPFQAFDAFRMLGLPHGVSVDVVGFPDSANDRQLTAEALLQEVRSAIRSARNLWGAACALTSP